MTEGSDDSERTEMRITPDGDSPSSRSQGASGSGNARFTPGVMLAGRYRVISLLGRGGMGEIYRAEDIRLGQQVALKFLPRHLASDSETLSRLYEEVRLGRQVSHPNVCRLYDIVEWEGHHFITMEYIDGEDLASLLRRIGRLPADKAIDITRDLAAGLAAAHSLGIVHRDLKPANVMIDGRGTARITDFGLAALSADLEERREISGTPAYMAPEQLSGGQVTVRTDLYAFGLIVYEMFLGKRLYEAQTLGEIVAQQRSVRSESLSRETRELDPAVQRVMLRCLEVEPEKRPASVHAVIAALPGGDPLQAAIEAGETPSPEMVAAAGRVGDVSVGRGWLLLAALILSLIAAVVTVRDRSLHGYIPEQKSRDVLADRARTVSERLGVPAPRDSDYYWVTSGLYLRWIRESGSRSVDALRTAPPSANLFLYRSSPDILVTGQRSGRVQQHDPPEIIPGMATLMLGQEGRLLWFRRVPPAKWSGEAVEPDWTPAFVEAGLEIDSLRPATPEWTPPFGHDVHRAWEGHWTGREDIPLRIEAAAHSGEIIWFDIIEPWQKPIAAGARRVSPGVNALVTLTISALIVAAIFARRNVVRGRGDRRGARRLASVVFLAYVMGMMAAADHVPVLTAEYEIVITILGVGLYTAAFVWLMYLAVEPYIRRRWPRILVAWSRAIAGRWRDPLVGRDVLLGLIAGTLTLSAQFGGNLAATHFFGPDMEPTNRFATVFMSRPEGILTLFGLVLNQAVLYALGWATLLVLFRLLLRGDRLALVALVIVASFVGIGQGHPLLEYAVALASLWIMVLLLWRVGILGLAAAFFAYYVLLGTPLTFDLSVWYGVRSYAVLFVLAGIGFWGFYVALAGKSIFGSAMLEEVEA
jgi:hypothetical protein